MVGESSRFANGDRAGLRGFPGTAIADGSGEIQLFVDENISAGEQRTWYEFGLQPALDLLRIVAGFFVVELLSCGTKPTADGPTQSEFNRASCLFYLHRIQRTACSGWR